MDRPANILFSGVGGQGIILASDITAHAVMRSGLDVKKSEIHGMAQRGGSVVAHLRFGEKIYSPVIERGTADIQVSFEMLESLRYLPYMGKRSTVILNTQEIPPLSVSAGTESYPPGIVTELRKRGLVVYPLEALDIALSLGEIRTVNMIMLGALSLFLPIDATLFEETIREKVKERFIDINLEAFRKGRTFIGQHKEHTSQTRK